MKIGIICSVILLGFFIVAMGSAIEKTNMRKQQNSLLPTSLKNDSQIEKAGDVKKTKTVPKPISMKWHHDPFVPKKPKNCPIDDDVAVSCSVSPRKCLADFNNPSESAFVMKSGDRRDSWHDARVGACSPSCRLAMGKGGLNPKLSFSI